MIGSPEGRQCQKIITVCAGIVEKTQKSPEIFLIFSGVKLQSRHFWRLSICGELRRLRHVMRQLMIIHNECEREKERETEPLLAVIQGVDRLFYS